MKKLICVAIMVMMMLGASSAARAGVFDLDAVIAHAEELAAAGEYDKAMDALLLAGLEAAYTDRPRLHVARAEISGKAGDYLRAIEEYGTALRASGGDACIRARRAAFFESIGEYGAALTDADPALEGGCSEPALLALRGRIYLWQNDYVNAAAVLSESLDDPALRADSLADLAIAYMSMGFPDVAVSYLREAAKLRPDDAAMISGLADALSMSGNLDESLGLYKRSLEIDPKQDITANNYGYTLYVAGRADEALEALEALNSENPSAYSLCNVMEIHLSREEIEPAYRAGSLCLATFEAKPGLADHERYYVNAVRMALESMGDRPSLHPRTQIDIARQALEAGDTAAALSGFLFALMLEPSNAEALLEAGKLYALLGETGKAGSFLSVAASLSGRNSDTDLEARRVINRNALELLF